MHYALLWRDHLAYLKT